MTAYKASNQFIKLIISFHNGRNTETESTAIITADLTLQIFQACSITAFLLTQTERATAGQDIPQKLFW